MTIDQQWSRIYVLLMIGCLAAIVELLALHFLLGET